ncbi:MAG: TIGR04282 family arsenosugar biosynthesis glycosyltransferase, partial [Candidatus Latescibacteria bacterium]|nr:TIGR04282 family arsenosugar biosynthesis glycosyltransferase [Candidatus Latescibacterota bacterium]
PGQVKTRLHSELGPEGATDLYRAFLLDLFCVCRRVHCEQRVIVYSPEGGSELVKEIDGFTVRTQVGWDLGERLEEAFNWAFFCKAERVIVIGSDSPSLPESYVENAFSLLQDKEAVLGPSWDGGYYLIGMTRHRPDVFRGINWSTDRVFEQTLDRIKDLGMSLGLLPPWYDIDWPEDLRFFVSHLRGMIAAGEEIPCPESYRVLRERYSPQRERIDG